MPREEKDLRTSLREYKQAIEEEFDAIEAEDTEAILTLVKKKFAAQALTLAEEVVLLAKVAESEAVKLNAIKYAFEFIFGKDAEGETGIDALIKKLTATPSDDQD